MRGFTLIELLVTLTLIGILTGIALPQYRAYRERAFDTRAEMDLRHVALAEEAYFMDAERYLSCENTDCKLLPGIATLSRGTILKVDGSAGGFTGQAHHPQGSGKVFRWDSAQGGLIEN